MANKAYLYSESRDWLHNPPEYHDISEWSNEVPLSYRILMSGNPIVADSVIFDGKGMAIISDYDSGVDKLMGCLKRAGFSHGHTEVTEIEKSLVSMMKRGYGFRLEPLEIFSLSNRDYNVQMNDLLHAIGNVESDVLHFIQTINSIVDKRTIFGRLFGRKTPDIDSGRNINLYANGFGFWCDVLFYSLEKKSQSAAEKMNEVNAKAKRDYWRSKI